MTKREREEQSRIKAAKAKAEAMLLIRSESDARTADEVLADAYQQDAEYLQKHWSWYLEGIEREVAANQGVIDRFKTRLEKDPADAFSWGTDAVKSAAVIEVYSKALEALRKHGPQAYRFFVSRVQEMATYPPQSTSPMSNLTEQYRLAAWATLVRESRWLSR